MKIEINNHRKVFAIQEEFNSYFPNLKLGFYQKSNTSGGSSLKKPVKSSRTLADCRTMAESGFISIASAMTAGELKQNFGDAYGLSMDVFQKSEDNTWNELPAGKESIPEELNK